MNIIFKLFSKICWHVIDTYKLLISPYLGHQCRFNPTCSAYAKNTLEKRHFLIALPMIFWRLLCCWPPGDYLIALEKSVLKINKSNSEEL